MNTKVFDIKETTTSYKTSIANGFCKYFTNVDKTLQTSRTTLGNTVWRNHDRKNLSKRINYRESQFSFENVSVSNMVKLLRQWSSLREVRSKLGGSTEFHLSFIPSMLVKFLMSSKIIFQMIIVLLMVVRNISPSVLFKEHGDVQAVKNMELCVNDIKNWVSKDKSFLEILRQF